MKERLEDKLKSNPGPPMPPAVEERVRKRLHDEMQPPPPGPGRRSGSKIARASYGKLFLLAVLLTLAGWVVVHDVVPVVRSTWDRLCAPGRR